MNTTKQTKVIIRIRFTNLLSCHLYNQPHTPSLETLRYRFSNQDSQHNKRLLRLGYANPGRQIAMATKFCMVAPSTKSSVLNLLRIILLDGMIFKVAHRFCWKFVHPYLKILPSLPWRHLQSCIFYTTITDCSKMQKIITSNFRSRLLTVPRVLRCNNENKCNCECWRITLHSTVLNNNNKTICNLRHDFINLEMWKKCTLKSGKYSVKVIAQIATI